MPKLVHKLPSHRLHRASGQAVLTLGGRDIYLGPHGTWASKAEYDRVIAEWLAHGRHCADESSTSMAQSTVKEMVIHHWIFAKSHYQRDGQPTGELDNIRDALRPLRDLYGHTPASQSGPPALKAVRRVMIDAGLTRTTVNFRVSKIRRAFKWAADNELIASEVYQA